MRFLTSILTVALLPALTVSSARAVDYDSDDAFATSQAALGNAVHSQDLRDTAGQTFQLSQLNGKPLIISMIYTSCAHVCPIITKNLARTVDIANEALGEDSFDVVTIGFDWAVDTPERMRLYAAERGISVPNWHFLAGDAASIEAISADLGFLFYPSPKGFDHLTQTTVIDGDGRVYRQVYGVELDPPSLVEPLKDLIFNTPRQAGLIQHWSNTFRLFCTVYDPNSGRYTFDYSIAMTIFVGIVCLGAIATFVMMEWRRAR